MLRMARNASRRGSFLAGVVGKTLIVAIALLIVAIGVLATQSRLHPAGQSGTSWHITKSSRMAECGGEKLVPRQTDDSRPPAPILKTEVIIHYSPVSPIEVPLSELAGVPQSHGLRGPPRA
ncbi:MAG: hypothetical protein ABSF71_27840 [Terriglobia bacterium]